MTKVKQKLQNCNYKLAQKNSSIKSPFLDKLAQLSPSHFKPDQSYTIETLCKRAKAKYLTNAYTIQLAGLKSPLQKSYNNTVFGCSNLLIQSGNIIKGGYCGNRWCIVCNRIRTAKLINGYKEPLKKLKDKQFVTLTIPNVDRRILRLTIKNMIHEFQNIRKYFHKNKIKFIGVRKFECTYNPKRNDYHPHFHLIVEGKDVAEKLVYEWLKRYTKAKREAQDIKPCNDGSLMELFKYFTKFISDKKIYVRALDNVFVAIRGLRVYQPFGIRKVNEEIKEIQTQIIEDLVKAEKLWVWKENDWIDEQTGECLTGYTPDDTMKELIENIKY